MAATLFGNSYGYEPEQRGFANLSRIAVRQKFDQLAADGLSQNQESVIAVLDDLHQEFDFSRLHPAALAVIDSKCGNVGLRRESVVEALEQQKARFRDNFRPSVLPRPGRNA